MNYLIGAYSVVTVILTAYLFVLGNRRKNLQKEIEYLKQMD